ncbi:MAG: asparaginase [candidate division Zixibacteria bacterium]
MTDFQSTEPGLALAAQVYRGKTVESEHFAAVAVVDSAGALTHFLGDPNRMIATRSSIKSFQALAMVKAGLVEKLGLTQKQLAIICASHNGSDEHRETTLSVLEAAGNSQGDLGCGAHWPLGMQIGKQHPTAGEESDPLRHNCSGKHAGFLALCQHLGEDLASYLDPDSKTQRLVRHEVGNYCQFAPELIGVGIDGCSAPVLSMPLINLAIGFQKLASGIGSDDQELTAVTKIRAAQHAHPLMVSGAGRFDFALSQSMPGNVLCKVGAEAIQAIGLADPPIGIAVKVLDGSDRAREPICIEILKQLAIIRSISNFPMLERFEQPRVYNDRGLQTGKIVPRFELERI